MVSASSRSVLARRRRPGEVADLSRVDHRQRQPGRGQGRRHRDLKAAGRLEHHQRRADGCQALGQGREPWSVATHGERLGRRPQMHVEPVLGDIDADEHETL
jgi:hypothetical protein